MIEQTIGFIGIGKMGAALIEGLQAKKVVTAAQIIACDADPQACSRAERELGVKVAADNKQVAQDAPAVVLAVKPNVVADVLDEIAEPLGAKLLISIAAGIPTAAIEARLGESARVIRVMPNTPCQVGEAAACFALGKQAQEEDAELVQSLFGAVGVCLRVEEKLMDAVTGLSGSGPAYVALIIEALSDGGVKMGLPRDVATQLAAQTVLGTGKMILEQGIHPGQLKDQVTSPGGTTVEGLHVLERAGVRGAFVAAVEAATNKSRLLAGK